MDTHRLDLKENDKIGQYTVVQLLYITVNSTVYFTIDPDTNEKIVVATRYVDDDTERERVKKEIELVKSFENNKYIIKYINHGMTQYPNFAFVAMPYNQFGSLIDMLTFGQAIDEEIVRNIIFQTLLAVKPLHQDHIIHHMVIADKILIENDLPVKIVLKGFQFAEKLPVGEHSVSPVGALPYMAPEILRQEPYDTPVDIWSLGVTAYAVLSNQFPFHVEDLLRTPPDYILRQQEQGPDYQNERLQNRSANAINFLQQTLAFDPANRITVTQALAHPWFQGLVDDTQ